MNLFGLNIHISRRGRTAAGDLPLHQKDLEVTPEEWLAGEDVGGPTLSNAYEQVVWVYRAINVLAEQVANIPFLFSTGERGRENLLTSGLLPEFYARPHPHLNRFQYWELRVIWLMLRGECFRIPIFDDASPGRRRLRAVLLPDPAHFQHVVEDHQLIGWRYTGFGPHAPLAGQVFLPEEVWFERLPNPFDFWRGLPPLYVASPAAQTDFSAGAFMRGIIENNADTGVIVRTDKWLAKEQRAQIFAALRDRKRRAGRADNPVIVTGCAEVIKPELSGTDLQFLENRKFTRAEICAAFGVPEEIVTTTDHAKYDVMSGARLNFIENRVAPLCARLEAEEEITVKQLDSRASGWFDLDSLPILQDARRKRLDAARTGFEMGVPFNELNRVLDLGFKPLPWGDQGFVPATLHPADTATRNSPRATSNRDSQLSAALRSKFRRFLFEQRSRVLAALASADPANVSAAALVDAPAEEEKWLALLPAALASNGSDELPRLRRIVSALQAELAPALAAGESPAQLTARVRAFYNTCARVDPAPAPEGQCGLNDLDSRDDSHAH